MARIRTVASALTVTVLAVLAVSACSPRAPAEVVSPWPVANFERVIPKPPEPIRWPLSGLPAADAAQILRRPLSIKIENSAAARPQTGMGSADVVYETITEGGETRFNCIFQSTLPKSAGPTRSARLSDLWIVPQYHALFVFSGASSTVNRAVKSAGLPNLSEDAGVTFPYTRITSRSAPHNLYVSPQKAYVEAVKRGMAVTDEGPRLQFAASGVDETPTITSIVVPFSTVDRVTWSYDAQKRMYLRQHNAKKHVDAGSGKQLSAANVVVMWAKYTPRGRDKVGSTTYDIALGGSGRVSVFHDGQRFDGTWTADRTAPPRFKLADGTPIKLAPGSTWFQVVPLDVSITMK